VRKKDVGDGGEGNKKKKGMIDNGLKDNSLKVFKEGNLHQRHLRGGGRTRAAQRTAGPSRN